ncbi:MAG: hypothetical protein JXA08_03230 [Methanomicrobiaceae archaeon]|nr:hypothetical protein [Methanomicrobiaceae archaeon]
MDLAALRTWTIFYLISFVVLLWALFLTTQGVLLGFGLTLVIVVVGLNFFFVSMEVKRIAERRELMSSLSATDPEDYRR